MSPEAKDAARGRTPGARTQRAVGYSLVRFSPTRSRHRGNRKRGESQQRKGCPRRALRKRSHLAALAFLSLLTEADRRQAGQIKGGAERCHQQKSGRQQPHLLASRGEGTISRGCSPSSPNQRLAEAVSAEAEAGNGGVTTALRPRRLRSEAARPWAPS